MIPRANITSWRGSAPWPENAQVEQDLVLSRALITMYEHPVVAEQAVFRGGTALHKLFCEPPVIQCFARYLEFGGTVVTRAQFESNMSAKMQDPAFRDDVLPLLRPGLHYDVDAAWAAVHDALVARLPGAPWKGAGDEG